MFTKAIVKRPCQNMVNGITSAQLGQPDYETAVEQHNQYIKALQELDIEVIELDKDENFPDSVFVEDTAVLSSEFAVITNPGAISRKGETEAIQKELESWYTNLEFIRQPGNLDGGDVMQTGKHFFVGLTDRTDKEGARQFDKIVRKYGYSSSTVLIDNMLHLKTGVSYMENNNLLVTGELSDHKAFQTFNKLPVKKTEAYSANSIWINGTVIIPKGYPSTKKSIEGAGYPVVEIGMSEFQKLDGGLSCLSLRF